MTLSQWPDLHVDEIDGVPTAWSRVPGPLRAGLFLRVGYADETLVTSGVSHLLEHLALFGFSRPGDHSNGQVEATTTLFHCTGDDATVVDFLRDVTRQLVSPPTERLEDERGVLRTEAASRGPSAEGALLTWRYGARTYGLAGQQELGLEHLTAEDLLAWSVRYATTGNAALWLSGPPPAGLALSLPPGPRHPAPDAREAIVPALPAYFPAGDSRRIALHAVLDRGYANAALADVVSGRLLDALRVDQAVAYSPRADYGAVTADAGRLLVFSDLAEGRATDGARLFMAVLSGLAGQAPVREEELAGWHAARDRQADEPAAQLGFTVSQAWSLAFGSEVRSFERAEAEMRAVRPEEVTAAATAMMGNALVMQPQGVRFVRDGWSAAPGISLGAAEVKLAWWQLPWVKPTLAWLVVTVLVVAFAVAVVRGYIRATGPILAGVFAASIYLRQRRSRR